MSTQLTIRPSRRPNRQLSFKILTAKVDAMRQIALDVDSGVTDKAVTQFAKVIDFYHAAFFKGFASNNITVSQPNAPPPLIPFRELTFQRIAAQVSAMKEISLVAESRIKDKQITGFGDVVNYLHGQFFKAARDTRLRLGEIVTTGGSEIRILNAEDGHVDGGVVEEKEELAELSELELRFADLLEICFQG